MHSWMHGCMHDCRDDSSIGRYPEFAKIAKLSSNSTFPQASRFGQRKDCFTGRRAVGMSGVCSLAS
jgi:hypothetical protein